MSKIARNTDFNDLFLTVNCMSSGRFSISQSYSQLIDFMNYFSVFCNKFLSKDTLLETNQ